MHYKETDKSNIFISASFTATSLDKPLKHIAQKMKFDISVKDTGYNQVFQNLCDDNSMFMKNKVGLNVILIRVEDFIPYRNDKYEYYSKLDWNGKAFGEYKNQMRKNIEDFLEMVKNAIKKLEVPLLILVCPTSTNFMDIPSWRDLIVSVEEEVGRELGNCDCTVLNTRNYEACYSINSVEDDRRNLIGDIPYTDIYFVYLAIITIRYFYSIEYPRRKVIAVDCDHTLWGGVCAEDDKLDFGGEFRSLHKLLMEQAESGMLLAICSKNISEDVWNVFDQMPPNLLKKDDFVADRINWDKKSSNLISIAKQLNVGLDSFMFIDDNPMECAEVEENCPKVLALHWPQGDIDRKLFLQHSWDFDRYGSTHEDKKRVEMMKQNLERDEFKKSKKNYSEFLKELNLELEEVNIKESDLQRISQLTKRTNQFNFTTIRRKANELERLLSMEKYEGLVFKAKDRFGDYGIVGSILFFYEADTLVIDTFLLSCRALGKGIEYRMIKSLAEIAAKHGKTNIRIQYTATEKNVPVKNFIHDILFQMNEEKTIDSRSKNESIDIEVKKLMNIKHHKQETFQSEQEVLSIEKESVSDEEDYVDLQSIMRSFADVAAIYREVFEINETKVPSDQAYKDILSKVRRIFNKILADDTIANHSNIEDFVHDSMKTVELTAALQNEFPDLPSTVLYECWNMEDIANYINKDKDGVYSNEVNTDAMCQDGCEDIAIIGISCNYPKAEDYEQFWDNLMEGKVSTSRVPKDRWEDEAYYEEGGNSPRKYYCNTGGFIENYHFFDCKHFQISPREAEFMDPQQKLFLMQVWKLFEDACYTRDTIDRSTGVFVGAMTNDFNIISSQQAIEREGSYRASDTYQISNRISYYWDLHGPSLTIDTACSASGTAVHLACESLKRGECNTAVVGGVNLFLHPARFIQYSQMNMLSKSGICAPYGDTADGTIFGEGIGAILLKPLKQAQKDRDNIYAVIKGTAINAGGRTNGFMVPSVSAQKDLIDKALRNAGVLPGTITYVEGHGTGTILGDPIEVESLNKVLNVNRVEKESCALGSVKGNIGHLESGAAIAGIIKTVLQMRHKTIVTSLNSQTLNRRINFENTAFYVPQQPIFWDQLEEHQDGDGTNVIPRRAGVNSFGAGGSNAHIILEEYSLSSEEHQSYIPIFVLSSKTMDSLKMLIVKFLKFLSKETASNINLGDLAYSLQVGREHFKYRIAIVFHDFQDLCDKLSTLASHEEEGSTEECLVPQQKEMNLTFSDLEGRDYISALFKNGKFAKLANIWWMGGDIDWKALYQEPRQRISLPGYCFTGKETGNNFIAEKHISVEEKQVNNGNTKIDYMYLTNWESFEKKSNPKEHKDIVVGYMGSSEKFAKQIYNFYTKKREMNQITLINLDKTTNLDQIEHIDTIDCVYFISNSEQISTYSTVDESAFIDYMRCIQNKVRSFSGNIDLFSINVDKIEFMNSNTIMSGAGCIGLTYAIAQSEYRFAVRNIDICSSELNRNPKRMIENITAVPPSNSGELMLLRSDKLYVQVFAKVNAASNYNKSQIKNRGTYVIVGGSGTVGKIITKYFIDKYQATVIWIGRKPYDSSDIEKAAGRFDRENLKYYQADITENEMFTKVMKKIQSKYSINGVFFLAQTISYKDNIFTSKKEDTMNHIKTKLLGCNHLYSAFQGQKLDFFCVFSSAQAFSFSGAANLSGYAGAITLSESYIRSVMGDSFPVAIINWGFWKAAADKIESNANLYSLEDEMGCNCLENALKLRIDNKIKQTVCMNISPFIEENINRSSCRMNIAPKYYEDTFFDQVLENTKFETELEDLVNVYNQPELEKAMIDLLRYQLSDLYQGFCMTDENNKILRKYDRFLDECRRLLSNAGYLDQNGYIKRSTKDPWNNWNRMKERYGFDKEWGQKFMLIDTCLRNIKDILTGAKTAPEVIFPDSSMEKLEGVYKGNIIVDYYNYTVAQIVESYLAKSINNRGTRKIKILEVGAGTGGTSARVLEKIKNYGKHIEYYYTDLSKAFLLYAKDKFDDKYSFVKYQIFNAEKCPTEQGLEAGEYDIVLSTNCLHATRNINKTLANVKSLLLHNGILVLNEEVEKTLFTTLTFGLLDGWWLYEDEGLRITGAPLLKLKSWENTLITQGFDTVSSPVSESICLGQQVIVARSNGIIQVPDRIIDKSAKAAPVVTHSAPVSERVDSLEYLLVKELAEVLRIEEAEIDINEPFYEYGVDSIIGGAYVNKISRKLDISLNGAILFDYPTIDKLRKYIAKNHSNLGDINNQGENVEELDVLEEFMTGIISADELINKAMNEA